MLQLEQSIEGKARIVSFDKTSQLSLGIAELGDVVRCCVEGRGACCRVGWYVHYLSVLDGEISQARLGGKTRRVRVS